MAKKIPKKKSKISKDTKKDVIKIKRKRQLVNLALTVLLVLVIASSLIIILRNNIDLPIFRNIKSLFPEKQDYAAIVGDEVITVEDLNERYDQIPAEYQQYITKDDLLEQMIDEKLLMKKADELNIEVSDEEVNSYIENITSEAGTTVEEFEALLKQNGLTLDDAREVYKRSLRLNKVADQLIFNDIEVSEIDIEDYYYENPEQFTSPESINVSHILICHNQSERCESNLTKDEAYELAQEVKDMVDENNFGELALEYSDEPAAQVTRGNLGWLNRDLPFDKTFLNASFALEEGEVSDPVETVFGYHIIKVFEKRPEQTLDLDVVYDSINQTIRAGLEEEAYMSYMDQLRNETQIEYFDLEE